MIIKQYCHQETIFDLNRKKIKTQTGGIDVHRQLGWKSLITAVAPQLHDDGWQGIAQLLAGQREPVKLNQLFPP